jgi:hypothetical protein
LNLEMEWLAVGVGKPLIKTLISVTKYIRTIPGFINLIVIIGSVWSKQLISLYHHLVTLTKGITLANLSFASLKTTMTASASGMASGIGIIAAAIFAIISVIGVYKQKQKEIIQAQREWTEASLSAVRTTIKNKQEQKSLLESMAVLSDEEAKNLNIKDKLFDKYKDLKAGTKEYIETIVELSDEIDNLNEKEKLGYQIFIQSQIEEAETSLKELTEKYKKRYQDILEDEVELFVLGKSHLTEFDKYLKDIDEPISKVIKRLYAGKGEVKEYEEILTALGEALNELSISEDKNTINFAKSIREIYTKLGKIRDLKQKIQDLDKEFKGTQKVSLEDNEMDTLRNDLQNLLTVWQSYYGDVTKSAEERTKAWENVETKFRELETKANKKKLDLAKTEQKEYENYVTSARDMVYQARKKIYEKHISALEIAYQKEQALNTLNNKENTQARQEYIDGLKEREAYLSSINKQTEEQQKEHISILSSLNGMLNKTLSDPALKAYATRFKEAKEQYDAFRKGTSDIEVNLSDVEEAFNAYREKAKEIGKPEYVMKELDLLWKAFLNSYTDRVNKFREKLNEAIDKTKLKSMDISEYQKDLKENENNINSLRLAYKTLGIESKETKKEIEELLDKLDQAGKDAAKFAQDLRIEKIKESIEGATSNLLTPLDKTEYEKDLAKNEKAIEEFKKEIEKLGIESEETKDELNELLEKFAEAGKAAADAAQEIRIDKFAEKLQDAYDTETAPLTIKSKAQKELEALQKKIAGYREELEKLGVTDTKRKAELEALIDQTLTDGTKAIKLMNTEIKALTKSIDDLANEKRIEAIKSLFGTFQSNMNIFDKLTYTFTSRKPAKLYDELIEELKNAGVKSGAGKLTNSGNFVTDNEKGLEIASRIAELIKEKQINANEAILDSTKHIAGQLKDIWQEYYNWQNEKIQEWYQNRTEKISQQAEDEHRSAEWLERKKEKLDREKRKRERTLAIQKQVLDISQAIGSVALGAARALEAGIPLGPIFAKIIGTLGAIQIGIIASQKYEKGGIVGGKPHSQGGTTFVGSDGSAFEAERGELITILNKKSTGLLQTLSNWNMLGGGSSFFGSSLNKFAKGGVVTTNSSDKIISGMLNRMNEMQINIEVNSKTLTDLEIYKKTRQGQRRARIYGN